MENTENKIGKIDKLISLTEKKLSLLKELKDSILYEKADYIVKNTNLYEKFLLYKKELGNSPVQIQSGTLSTIIKYLKKRGISNDNVFGMPNVKTN